MARSKLKQSATSSKPVKPAKAKLKAVSPSPPPAEESENESANEEDWVSEDESGEELNGEENGTGFGSDDSEDSEEDAGEDDENDEDDSEDIDEEGLQNLMRALEKHPLDDFERAQLGMLAGDEEGSGSEDEDEEEGEEVVMDEVENDEAAQEDSDEEQEEEEDIELDRLSPSHELHPDVVPKQKIQINDEIALRRIREGIALDSSLPWTETLVLTHDKPITVDPEDDLKRELAFYEQALHSTNQARKLAAAANFPFTRPNDFFAEMVKSDAHMERIRVRLLSESSTLKKAEEKRKEREAKKFGKQVQIEKLKEREKNKKEMVERVKDVKRKRKDILDAAEGDDAAFDVAVEDALTDRPNKKAKTVHGSSRSGPSSKGGKGSGRHSSGKISRNARDQKFGFGGRGRRDKSNTRESTDAFVTGKDTRGKGKGGKGGGQKQKRLGKNRRMAAKGRG